MVFLNKTLADGAAAVALPAPGDTRPLSLSNTDAKIVAKATSWPLKEAAATVVRPMQTGVLPGR
eukprot:5565641-Lingulodinium_polyedra.AAC.1